MLNYILYTYDKEAPNRRFDHFIKIYGSLKQFVDIQGNENLSSVNYKI